MCSTARSPESKRRKHRRARTKTGVFFCFYITASSRALVPLLMLSNESGATRNLLQRRKKSKRRPKSKIHVSHYFALQNAGGWQSRCSHIRTRHCRSSAFLDIQCIPCETSSSRKVSSPSRCCSFCTTVRSTIRAPRCRSRLFYFWESASAVAPALPAVAAARWRAVGGATGP